MLSLIGLIIPTLTSLLLYFFWNRKVVLLEFLILFACSFAGVGIVKLIADNQNTTDTEYWNGTKQEVRWYQAWDERVHCRHPEYCTRYNSCKSRDSKGNCQGGMETYQCGWQHPYDVDYHPEHWNLITTIGEYGISKSEYDRLKAKYGNSTFVDMHRDYHSIDGDMYKSEWHGQLDLLEMVTQEHTYENRVQASKSVFNYPEVFPEEVKRYALFEYPQVVNNYQKHILGVNDPKVEHEMDILNGLLGPKKQCTAFILVFKNKTVKAAELQEAYWKGGNKNEFIICIGVDNANNIQWCKPFSWSEVAEPKITIRNFVLEQKVLNLQEVAKFTYSELSTKFKRKHFRDFKYLTIQMTSGQLIAAVITTVMLNIIVAIWAVYNELEDTAEFVSEKLHLRPFFDKIKAIWNRFANWCKGIWNKITNTK